MSIFGNIYSSFQIANLKAALARKEGEPEYLSSLILSSGVSKMKSGGLSPMHSSQQNGDMSIDHSKHRQPVEDVGNVEVIIPKCWK